MTATAKPTKSPCKKLEALDPFDPANFRVAGTMDDALSVKKLLTRVAVRKPTKQEFCRATTDPDFRLTGAVLEMKEDREFYLVMPDMIPAIPEDVRLVELVLCMNRLGVPFLWPVPLPAADGRTNAWHESARDALGVAEASWMRMVASMAEGSYNIYRATGDIPDPTWPDKSMRELLALAFRDGKVIDGEDHPVLRQLSGDV
mgnify:CR=1 FL=1